MSRLKFDIAFDKVQNRRILSGAEVVVHCHHYNCQLQSSIESSDPVDGQKIIKDAAHALFSKELEHYLREEGAATEVDKWSLAGELYRAHGLGTFDFSYLDERKVISPSSHYAEGWKAKFGPSDSPRCSLAAGYIRGVYKVITGENVEVEEEKCQAGGGENCRFALIPSEKEFKDPIEKSKFDFTPQIDTEDHMENENVDSDAIIDAVSSMDFYGDEEGLVPAFGIYATNLPGEFYNRISYTFERASLAQGKDIGNSAKRLLIYGGEVCGLHTFHGIIISDEWKSLIAPMIETREDKIFALTAITNAFGWGNWHVIDLKPGRKLVMRSYNGYESLGYRQMFEKAREPKCYMLTGVSAGMMELIYSPGTLEAKFGRFHSEETKCISKGDPYCEFHVEKL